MGQSASEILQRFADEQSQIIEYVDLVRRTLRIDDFVISEINGKLAWAGLPSIATRSGHRLLELYDQQELEALLASLDVVQPRVQQYITDLGTKLDAFQKKIEIVHQHRKEVNAWKDHFAAVCLTSLRTEKEQADYAEAMIQQFPVDRFVDMTDEIQGIVRGPPNEEELAKRRRYIGQAFINGQNVATSTLAHHHQEILEWIRRTRSISKLIAHHAVVNLFRQGFLLLMTAFDAAVFDLTRAAIAKRFDTLAPSFAVKDKKYGIPEISRWVSSGDLTAAITEELVRSKRLQSLLQELEAKHITLVDTAGGKKNERLIEIIRRRNVHVHKRGLVDEEYVADFNLDNLSVGDLAAIDDAYFAEANAYCQFCVHQLAGWAAA